MGEKAFTILKSILPEDSFYNFSSGSSVIMTNNWDELYELSYNWPDATLLLCNFHVLHQVWRWLYESCHGIAKNDRVIIMKLFQKLGYAKDIEDYVQFSLVFASNILKIYATLVNAGQDVFEMMK